MPEIAYTTSTSPSIINLLCGITVTNFTASTPTWNLTQYQISDILYEKTGNVQYFSAQYANCLTANGTGLNINLNAYNTICIGETEEEKFIRVAREQAEKLIADAAEKKAEELLMLVLTDKQKEQYLKEGLFETEVDDRVYRLKKGWSGNVEQIVEGKAKYRYCVHPAEYVPISDNLVAQLLLLRNNEKEFLARANRTALYA